MKTLFVSLALLIPILLSANNQDTLKVKLIKKDSMGVSKGPEATLDTAIALPKAPKKDEPAEKDEYEIIVFDPGFDAFLVTQPSKNFYSEEYLRAKNMYLVSEWNMRYNSPSMYHRNIYGSYIDYNANIDYGLDFEYRLYMFFKFMEQEMHMSLVPSGWR